MGFPPSHPKQWDGKTKISCCPNSPHCSHHRSVTTQTHPQEQWMEGLREKIDEILIGANLDRPAVYRRTIDRLESLITEAIEGEQKRIMDLNEAIKGERERVRKMVEGIQTKGSSANPYDNAYHSGYYDGIEAILTLLTAQIELARREERERILKSMPSIPEYEDAEGDQSHFLGELHEWKDGLTNHN